MAVKRLVADEIRDTIPFGEGVRLWSGDDSMRMVLAAVIDDRVVIAQPNGSFSVAWVDVTGCAGDRKDPVFDDGPFLFDTVKEFGEWLSKREG